MEVVLLERVAKLGQIGEVVRVKVGYARNFLLPQGKALRATKANLVRFEAQRAQIEARNLELKKEAESVAETLDGQSFVVLRSASESGNLYGSVSARDIVDAATEAGFTIDRRQIEIARPVKALGLHPVQVVLHPEVSATVSLNVARTAEEAEIQASGKSIAELRAEEDAAEELDVAALFEDVGKFDDEEGDDREDDQDRDDEGEEPRKDGQEEV